MSTDKESLSYGQYLKAIRCEKGIHLEDVSAETRIGRDILLSIEKEDDTALPAEVFVKGFLRAYADVIGADGEEAVRQFCSRRKVVHETTGVQKLYVQPRRRVWPMLLAVFAALALLVSVTVYLTTEGSAPTRVPERLPQPTVKDSPGVTPVPESVVREKMPDKKAVASDQAEQTAENEDAGQPSKASGDRSEPVAETKVQPVPANPDKLILVVDAIQETWMKVIVDGGKPKEYTLSAGDRLDLEGRANFNLLIGNAGGVALTYNGRAIEVPGKSGQVVTLQLP